MLKISQYAVDSLNDKLFIQKVKPILILKRFGCRHAFDAAVKQSSVFVPARRTYCFVKGTEAIRLI